ncbi:MAG: DUF1501 domain-containing protein [Planctomycetaceae bacterium]|nr:DUF1501 domain-containing protein [Planctomycetaceae bacterium]
MGNSDTKQIAEAFSSTATRTSSWLRRQFLCHSGLGLGSIALSALLNDRPLLAVGPAARAKQIIYLHMIGAPSQLDLFDEKPELTKRDKQPCPAEITKNRDFAFIGKTSVLAGSPWKFQQYGEAKHSFSSLLPHMSSIADEMTFIHSMHTDEINHAPAQMFLHSGFGRGGRPSLGAWVTYGLGSENKDLPSYIVLMSGPPGGAGTSLWTNGFLPSVFQGTPFRSSGDAVLFLSSPDGVNRTQRQKTLSALEALNREHLSVTGDPEIETRIAQYEMAFRMQTSVPELMDLKSETRDTLEMYGAVPGKASFANNCLQARRLIEQGVRIVELYDSDWDHHGGIENRLPEKCRDIDRPIAALLKDLRVRGLLDETLVIWGSEFGRTPLQQGENPNQGKLAGRDHHKDAFTMWLAGGGIRAGINYGKTDDFGMDIVENGVHVHDLNATILHLLGIDHTQLTYRYQGRDFRLTDVHGNVVQPILQSSPA